MKTKIKSNGDEVTDFYDKNIPMVDSNHTYLAVISLVSAHQKDENQYPQIFLKECKCIEEKLIGHIIDDLESFSVDSDDSDDSTEEQIKAIKLMFLEKVMFENVVFEKAILKFYSGCLSSQ